MSGFIRFCSISSSSVYGNCYFVESPGGMRILIDCGVTLRRLERYLAEMGVAPESISAIFVTHDHGDHTAALEIRNPFAARYRIPVYATRGFWQRWVNRDRIDSDLKRTITPGSGVDLGDCRVKAFLKPHDSIEPVGYTVCCDGRALSIVTDLGCVPPEVADAVRDSTHLIFESNHDRAMELSSGRAARLIYRVLSDVGHLSNDQAARALSEVVTHETRVILLSHLSLDCNRPQLALRAANSALARRFDVDVEVAPADRPSRMFLA
ncbi:MAG: MBL fold metallo-hydrolase [Firmicutes bacterium]|nr:MBL fold metallo-hydrolase [Bacillota bacterium]